MAKSFFSMSLFMMISFAAAAFFFPTSHIKAFVPFSGTYNLGVEVAAGRYVAIDQNYWGVNYFAVPDVSWRDVHVLFDVSAYKLENTNWAASVGFGLRKWDNDRQKVYGINAFYDYREEKSKSFNQAGLGLELLSTYWELHINGYLPVSTKKFLFSTHVFDHFQGGFKAVLQDYQYALRGIEISGGRRFWLGDDLTFYLAPGFYYYNNSTVGDIQGIEGTLNIAWNSWVSFDLNASYDTRFKGRVQGVVNFSLPLENICSCICSSCESMILGRPIFRNDMIFLKKCSSVWKNWDNCGAPE